MGNTSLIPDRRRKHFPRNGGPLPTDRDRANGRAGLTAARKALAAAIPAPPSGPTIISRLTPEQLVRARQGIAAARRALMNDADPDTDVEQHNAAA